MTAKGHLASCLPEGSAQYAKLGEPRAIGPEQRQVPRVRFERVNASPGAHGEGRPHRMPAQVSADIDDHRPGAKRPAHQRTLHPFPGAIPAQDIAHQLPRRVERKGALQAIAPGGPKSFDLCCHPPLDPLSQAG